MELHIWVIWDCPEIPRPMAGQVTGTGSWVLMSMGISQKPGRNNARQEANLNKQHKQSDTVLWSSFLPSFLPHRTRVLAQGCAARNMAAMMRQPHRFVLASLPWAFPTHLASSCAYPAAPFMRRPDRLIQGQGICFHTFRVSYIRYGRYMLGIPTSLDYLSGTEFLGRTMHISWDSIGWVFKFSNYIKYKYIILKI